MNKNLYFKDALGVYTDRDYFSLGNHLPKKEKKMDSKLKYHVMGDGYHYSTSSYETLDEAIKSAKKMTMNTKEDTVIRQDVAVVRFPIPDYEVETLVPGTTV